MFKKLVPVVRKRWYFILPAVVFVVYFTIGAWSYYRTGDNFQQNTKYNVQSINNTKINALPNDVSNYLGKTKVTLSDNDTTKTTSASELGVQLDTQKLGELQRSQRLKSALLPFLQPNEVNIPLKFDDSSYYISAEYFDIAGSPKSATFVASDNQVSVKEGTDGVGFIPNSFKDALLNQLAESDNNIELTAKLGTIRPGYLASDINQFKDQANNIYSKSYKILDGNGVENAIDPSSLVAFLVPMGEKLYLPSNSAVTLVDQAAIQVKQDPVPTITAKYVSGKASTITQVGKPGRKVDNLDELSRELTNAIDIQQDYAGQIKWQEIPAQEQTITIDDTKPSAVLKYKITTAGNVTSDINEFRSKVAQTLNDARGWAQAGVKFVEVTSGEQFEIQLIEPALLPARYPGVCDAYYSCRVGRYVMINDNRWQGATDVWTGSIRDYQHMVVNHEVGHRLGRGHVNCPASGQFAPVMQQQSINLQGCVFNPWPLASEAAAVARTL